MDNFPIIFSFNDMQIRIFQDENSNPWFVAKDICDVLGHSNSRMAIQALDEDEKGVSKVYTLGGEQEMQTVSESGMYALILRSNKPEAKAFRKWVTSEVLPSIRKTGGYLLDLNMEEVKQVVNLPDPYKKEAFKRLLARADKLKDDKKAIRLILNISLIFAAAEKGNPIEQNLLTF